MHVIGHTRYLIWRSQAQRYLIVAGSHATLNTMYLTTVHAQAALSLADFTKDAARNFTDGGIAVRWLGSAPAVRSPRRP